MVDRGVKTKTVKIGDVTVGGDSPLILIAGPCAIEDEQTTLESAKRIKEITTKLGLPFIFKSSYLKSRSTIHAFAGVGLERGVEILEKVKQDVKIPVTSDIHSIEEIKKVSDTLDLIQIPALLSRQTRLLVEAARTGKPINVKKALFLVPQNVKFIIEKIESVGNRKILLTERGTWFGYYNIVNDFRAIPIMRSFGYPVIYDVSHSIRILGRTSDDPLGATPEFIPYLIRAGVAVGCDGLFIETHPDVKNALCNSCSMCPLDQLEDILFQAKEIYDLVKYELRKF